MINISVNPIFLFCFLATVGIVCIVAIVLLTRKPFKGMKIEVLNPFTSEPPYDFETLVAPNVKDITQNVVATYEGPGDNHVILLHKPTGRRVQVTFDKK